MARRAVLLLGTGWALLLGACDDPIGPCDLPKACEVDGVDLFISHLEIMATQLDSLDGLGVVDPGSLAVDVTVQNRGDSTSVSAILVLRNWWTYDDSIVVPPLEPGRTFQTRSELYGRRGHVPYRLAYDDTTESTADTTTATAQLLAADADTTNNWLQSDRVHVTVPMISVHLEPDQSEVWVGVPFHVRLTIVNYARHAALAPRAVGFILFALPEHDVAGRTAFGTHDTPTIPSLTSYERDLQLTVPSRAAWQSEAHEYLMVPATTLTGATDSMLFADRTYLGPGNSIWLHPDYHACQPPLLVPDSIVWSPNACDVYDIFVFELQARTDREYAFEQPYPPQEGVAIRRADGSTWIDRAYAGLRFRFDSPGTYWLVEYWGGPAYQVPSARAMRLLEWPITPGAPTGGRP